MKWKKWFSHLPLSAGSALLPLDQLPTELVQDTPALHRNLLLLRRKATNHQNQQKQLTPIGEKEKKRKPHTKARSQFTQENTLNPNH